MRLIRSWMRLVTALVLALMAAGALGGTALAAQTAPAPKWTTGRLESSYRHTLQDLQSADQRFTDAEAYAAKLDAIVADLKGKGQDTTQLVGALAQFRAKMGQLRTENQAARAQLLASTGFDINGKVVDKGVAERSLKVTKTSLENIANYRDGAYIDLHKAIQDYHNTIPDAKFKEPTRP